MDKAFNEQPMLVVVSNQLDPRIRRQLDAQLQSTMMSAGELEAEIENAQALENIKAQKDSVKDESGFDEITAANEQPPQPIEDSKPEEKEAPADDGAFNAGGESDTGGEGSGGDKPADDGVADDGQQQQSDGGDDSASPFDDGGDDAGKASEEGGTDSKITDEGEGSSDQSDATNDAGSDGKNNQAAGDGSDEGGDGDDGDDPFGVGGKEKEEKVNFESFYHLIGRKYTRPKMEDNSTPVTPPIKSLTVITGSNQGVDPKTSGVVATIEDPHNTVVVIDMTTVNEIDAKMAFGSLVKQLQSRGVLVLDSVDDAVDYLNKTYDELTSA